jgi:hypothetical protein
MAKGRKIGRSAGSGRFIPVAQARRQKATAVVEVVPIGKRKKKK